MNKLIDAPFFTQFLKVSNYYTAGGIALLILSLGVMKYLKDKRINFSKRMIYALILGLLLGVVIDLIGSDSEIYTEFARTEINAWYALVGSGFLKMIQLLAIPVVFLSIIKVVIDVKGERLKYLTGKTFATLLGTTAISLRHWGLRLSNSIGLTVQSLLETWQQTKQKVLVILLRKVSQNFS